MKPWTKVASATSVLSLLTMVACGGDKPEVKQPEAVSAPTAAPASDSAAPPASAAPAASAAPGAEPPKPAMKGAFASFVRSPKSGKVDKVGEKDGSLKPDGVKDAVFDVEYNGPATAFFVMTTDATGALTSEFDADCLVGNQQIPKELAPLLSAGKLTAGLAIFDGDTLLNGKDGALTAPLGEGTHKLSLHISSKSFPKSAVKVFALLPDGTLVKGPLLPK